MGGLVALLSVLSWFFAVCMPVMNRELRARMGVRVTGYWSELFEMFWRVLLCAATGFFTLVLLQAALKG